jgi:hypothetical protein
MSRRPTSRRARLAPVDLPAFGRPVVTPDIPVARYAERLERLRARMD